MIGGAVSGRGGSSRSAPLLGATPFSSYIVVRDPLDLEDAGSHGRNSVRVWDPLTYAYRLLQRTASPHWI